MPHPYTQLTKPIVRDIQTAALARLSEWAADRGLTVTFAGGKFTGQYADLKLRVAVIAPDAPPPSPEADAFRLNAVRYGLAPVDLGREVLIEGHPYRVAGLRPRAPKRPVLLQSTLAPDRRIAIGADYARLLLSRGAGLGRSA